MTVWSAINAAYCAVFFPWFDILAPLAVWLQILITAIPVTLLALLVFRYASNQDGIRLAKDRIKGHLLELWLYKDDLSVMLQAQRQVILYSMRYMALALVPMAVMIFPLGPVIVQIESQFAFQGLPVGESAIISVAIDKDEPVDELNVSLLLPAGVSLETPVLRIDETGELMWRIRADAPGQHSISIAINDEEFERRLLAGVDTGALWPHAFRADDWRILGSAAEQPLPSESPVKITEIDYPRARGEFLGLSSATWLLLGFTLILGFALRGFFGVTF